MCYELGTLKKNVVKPNEVSILTGTSTETGLNIVLRKMLCSVSLVVCLVVE